MHDADVVVIGAGIYGCGVAYFLSRFGIDVAVVDAGDIGAGASGATAGNVHLQLSPFSHATQSAAWIAEYAAMLPFFVDALAAWKELDTELETDIELRCPGGVMVAESEPQLRRLQEKVNLERAHGLAIEMIGRAQLLRLAPYVADHVLGAAYCPGEGMANALLAVAGLADAAHRLGTRFVLNAQVTNLASESGHWHVDTHLGRIRARRVVIAAGSSSSNLAAMVGATLPLTQRPIQMIATEACEPFIEHLLYHAESRLTLKQVANGNVLIGGGWTASHDPVFGRPAVLADSLRGSLALAHAIVPRLAQASVILIVGGCRCLHAGWTPDSRRHRRISRVVCRRLQQLRLYPRSTMRFAGRAASSRIVHCRATLRRSHHRASPPPIVDRVHARTRERTGCLRSRRAPTPRPSRRAITFVRAERVPSDGYRTLISSFSSALRAAICAPRPARSSFVFLTFGNISPCSSLT